MTGTLYLVGVGPGDPELLTLKAARILGAAPVIAYPTTGEDAALALAIAEAHLNPAAERLPITIAAAVRTPSGETAAKLKVYENAAAAIDSHLQAGRDVAYICEGDPLFYGSAMYLLSLLGDRRRIEVVPGVTSLTAAAAAIPFPLVARFESLTTLTGPLPDDTLDRHLGAAGSVAILKVGRHYDRIRAALDRSGRAEGAWLVEHATRPQQRISRVTALPPGDKPYFSMVLSFSGAEFWL